MKSTNKKKLVGIPSIFCKILFTKKVSKRNEFIYAIIIMHTINDSDQFRKVFQFYFEFLNIIRVCQQVLDIKQKTGKKSSKFVYVLAKQCKSPFNLTNFLLKKKLSKTNLSKSPKHEKFMKVCLHSG